MSNTRELSQLASVITVDDNTKNVGVGSTNAQYKLDVAGDINFSGSLYQNKELYTTQNSWDNYGEIDGGTSTLTSVLETSIDSFSTSTYRSASYDIQIVRSTEYQTTTIKILHDNSNVYLTEFGTLITGSLLSNFSADIDEGNVRLLAIPTSATSTTFKLIRTLIKI
jgi:hypothetical protein